MVEVKRRDFSGIHPVIAKISAGCSKSLERGVETIRRSLYTSRLGADVAQSVEQRIRNA